MNLDAKNNKVPYMGKSTSQFLYDLLSYSAPVLRFYNSP